jgi:hypothetical protein
MYCNIRYYTAEYDQSRLGDDPEYYQSLSDTLKAIIEKHQEHWDQLVQLLLDFRDNVEQNRAQHAKDLGLSETQFAFHNILMAEIARARGNESIDPATHEEVITVTQDLVDRLDKATGIVDFFSKPDEFKLKVEVGKVSVVVPKSISQDKVEALVHRKTRWIREKLLLQRQYPPPNKPKIGNDQSCTYPTLMASSKKRSKLLRDQRDRLVILVLSDFCYIEI